MPRERRIQYPDAIYHAMARGDRREEIVRDDTDRHCTPTNPGTERVGKTGMKKEIPSSQILLIHHQESSSSYEE